MLMHIQLLKLKNVRDNIDPNNIPKFATIIDT